MLYLDASEPSLAYLQATEIASVFLALRDPETDVKTTVQQAVDSVVAPPPPPFNEDHDLFGE